MSVEPFPVAAARPVERVEAGGQATLIRADCLGAMAALAADGFRFDCVLTDPPYCSGGVTEAGRGRATHQGLRSEGIRNGRFEWFEGDNMTTAGLIWLLRSMAVAAFDLLKPTGHLLVFTDWRMVPMLAPALESAGFRYRKQIIWDKQSMGCGTGFRPSYEPVLHFTHRAPEFHARDVGDVIRCPRVHSSARRHPTEKPRKLLRDLIRVTTPPGGLVLDPFAGSGSTGEACRDEGRRAVLIERSIELCARIRKAEVRPASLDPPEPHPVQATLDLEAEE